jgi:hypothetical protein
MARAIGILFLQVIVPPFDVFRPTVLSFPKSNNKTFPVLAPFISMPGVHFRCSFFNSDNPDFIGYALINLLLDPNKCYNEWLSTELYCTVIIS